MSANAAELKQVRADVQATARKLLLECAVSGPPTPTDRLLAFCKLAAETFTFSDMAPPLTPGKRESAKDAAQRQRLARMDLDLKVRGILDSQDRVVYTHATLTPEPRRFCTFHELGHYLISWQQAILCKCTELDLSGDTLAGFEREANWFAQECAFQGDHFAAEAGDYAISIRTIRKLAKSYSASFEATARRFVETHAAPVALLGLETRPDLGSSINAGEPLLAVRYAVTSPALRRFNRGYISAGTLIPFRHPATSVLLAGSNQIEHCAINLEFAPDGKTLPCEGEIFYNNYRVFVLAWPGRNYRGG